VYKKTSLLVVITFFLCIFCFQAVEAKKEKLILKDHGKKLEIKDLDGKSVTKDEDYCDLDDPSHCDPKIKPSKNKKVDFTKSKFKTLKYKDLNDLQKRLLDAAQEVSKKAYNPYSHFHVGAALRCTDGEVITGTNFENAAYGSTICAERAAILRANSKGKKDFSHIAIFGKGKDFDSEDPVSPCGACRQVIMEIAQLNSTDIQVIMSNSKKDKIIIASISELLPLGFGPQNLGIEI
jgi:cytidine deaminase